MMFGRIHFVSALSTYGSLRNSFKNSLDLFWTDQKVLYSYKANITGNRGIKL